MYVISIGGVICAFVDDRTVFKTSEHTMKETWRLTHLWEDKEHWQMNVSKGAIGCVGKVKQSRLEHRGQSLPKADVMRILGIQLD